MTDSLNVTHWSVLCEALTPLFLIVLAATSEIIGTTLFSALPRGIML